MRESRLWDVKCPRSHSWWETEPKVEPKAAWARVHALSHLFPWRHPRYPAVPEHTFPKALITLQCRGLFICLAFSLDWERLKCKDWAFTFASLVPGIELVPELGTNRYLWLNEWGREGEREWIPVPLFCQASGFWAHVYFPGLHENVAAETRSLSPQATRRTSSGKTGAVSLEQGTRFGGFHFCRQCKKKNKK